MKKMKLDIKITGAGRHLEVRFEMTDNSSQELVKKYLGYEEKLLEYCKKRDYVVSDSGDFLRLEEDTGYVCDNSEVVFNLDILSDQKDIKKKLKTEYSDRLFEQTIKAWENFCDCAEEVMHSLNELPERRYWDTRVID